MKKLLIFFAFLSVLAGCDSGGDSSSKTFTLKCGSYDVAIKILDADTLQTAVNGEKITMNRANYASEMHLYKGRGAVVSVSLWNKGQNWSLDIDNGRRINCVALQK